MPDEFDPFAPVSGLKDDFSATITDGMFVVDLGNHRASIQIDMDVDDGTTWQLRYGLGPAGDWDTYDGGVSVKHVSGNAKQGFRGDSAYSDFMVHAMEAGARDEMYAVNKLYEGQGPHHAKMWVGFRFHFNVLSRPARVPLNNEDGTPQLDENGKQVWGNGTVNRTLPTKFLGVVGQESLPLASQGGSGPGGDPLDYLDPVTAGKVRQAARDAAKYTDFVDAMLQLTDKDDVAIMDFEQIGQAVADEGWWQRLHNS